MLMWTLIGKNSIVKSVYLDLMQKV